MRHTHGVQLWCEKNMDLNLFHSSQCTSINHQQLIIADQNRQLCIQMKWHRDVDKKNIGDDSEVPIFLYIEKLKITFLKIYKSFKIFFPNF